MAHEIKNALVAVKTFLDLLAEKHQDTELAEVALREIRRIESIVGSVLNYAVPRTRAAGAVRLHEVIEHTLKLARPRIEGKPIQVVQRFKAGSDLVKADDHQLQQVFLNLIFNALDAMGAKGTLTISTGTVTAAGGEWPVELGTDGGLRVTIHDTGSGMTADARRRLFEPFFTTKPGGTGLGLSITRGILKEHGGEIELDCTTGAGTTFHVFLPEFKRIAHGAIHPRSHGGRGD
jgi:signal transduction histidine kinase